MATSDSIYGQFPGVRISVTGGGISNAQIGREQKLVLFGRGNLNGEDSGEASPNQRVRIRSRVDAGDYFGRDSRLAEAVERALENKGSHNYIYAIAHDETAVTDEAVTAGQSLANAPIIEDTDEITVDDETAGPDVVFRYESPPEPPTDDSTVHINPLTGEFEASDTAEHLVDYKYADWQSALDAADPILNHAEVGVYTVLSDAEPVADMLSTKLSGDPEDEDDRGLRGEYKLAMGLAGAQPNMTTADGDAAIDVSAYSDTIDDDAVFLAGPARRSGEYSTRTILGGLGGLFAGNALENPIYGDRIRGYGSMSQELTRASRETLRDQHRVIPVVDDYRDGGAGITVQGHSSTSTADDWDRTYQNRRITDLVILMQRRIGDAAVDNLMRNEQLRQIETQIISGFERLARAGLIHGDPDGQNRSRQQGLLDNLGEESEDEDATPYFAEAVRSDTNTISVSSGFSPIGVTTAVDIRITVSDAIDAFSGNGGDE